MSESGKYWQELTTKSVSVKRCFATTPALAGMVHLRTSIECGLVVVLLEWEGLPAPLNASLKLNPGFTRAKLELRMSDVTALETVVALAEEQRGCRLELQPHELKLFAGAGALLKVEFGSCEAYTSLST
jgi:hypothetical protein